MATSSILTNVKITDPKKIESFIKALDASADDPKMVTSSILTNENITDPKKLNPLSRLLMLRQMIPKESHPHR